MIAQQSSSASAWWQHPLRSGLSKKEHSDGSEEKGEEEVEEEGLRPSRIQGRDVKQRALEPTSRMRWAETSNAFFFGASQRDQDGAGADQCDAQPVERRQPLAEKDDGKHGDEDDAEFVDRRHPRGVAELKGAEIA